MAAPVVGLTISKKLAEIMGSGIALESGDGKGSTFSFTVRFSKVKRFLCLAFPEIADIRRTCSLVVDTKLPSSTHPCCLLVALLDALKCTPASAPRRCLSAPSNATWYDVNAASREKMAGI